MLTVSNLYNLVGRVSQLTYPTGRINQYTFDNNYLPSTIVSNSTTVATYTFNGVNAPVTKTLGNNVSLNIQYNNRYQVTKHDWKKSGLTIAGYNYGQDNVGNRIWSENLVTANKSELFAFDNADRLTSFKTGTLNGSKTAIITPTYTQGWTLDSIGNWAGFNDNGANSTNIFNNTHEMTQFKGVTNTFDNNGNLTSDGIRSFKYDAFNRIIQVKVGAVVLANYQYDAFNRRVLKTVDADLNGVFETTIKFLYDGFRCIEELNASDALTKEYVFGGLYIDEVILQRTGATDYYFLHDYRYSVTGLTNSAGTIVESYDYKVFGERTIIGSGLTDIGYTGQRHDSETGLMYFKNRYYSTAMGSFVTCDPKKYINGMSMYLGYFGGMGKDPFGLFDIEWQDSGTGGKWSDDEKEILLAAFDKIYNRVKIVQKQIEDELAILPKTLCFFALKEKMKKLIKALNGVENKIYSNYKINVVKTKNYITNEGPTDASITSGPGWIDWWFETPFNDRQLTVNSSEFFSSDAKLVKKRLETTLHEISHLFGTDDGQSGNSFNNAHEIMDLMSIDFINWGPYYIDAQKAGRCELKNCSMFKNLESGGAKNEYINNYLNRLRKPNQLLGDEYSFLLDFNKK